MNRPLDALRPLLSGARDSLTHEPRPGVVVLGAGKGGVGTSAAAALIAIAAHRKGERVLLVDADASVGSIPMMFGVADPGPGISAIRGGRLETGSLMVALAPGFHLLSVGGRDAGAATELSTAERRSLLRRVAGLYEDFTMVIVDGGSSADSVMAACSAGAERLLCVTTPDRISLAATYALFKVVRGRFETLPMELIVAAADEAEGRGSHEVVRTGARVFLTRDIPFAGAVPTDAAVTEALEHGSTLYDIEPHHPAPAAAAAIVERLLTQRAARATTPVIPLSSKR